MKKTTEVLLNAAFALTPKEHWTKGYFARDAKGRVTLPFTEDAASWCLHGAIGESTHDDVYRNAAYKCIQLVTPGAEYSVGNFNDRRSTTHAAVLDALYKAAEYAEEAEWTK